MDYLDYRELVGIGYSNAEQVIAFKKRMLNLLKNVGDVASKYIDFEEF